VGENEEIMEVGAGEDNEVNYRKVIFALIFLYSNISYVLAKYRGTDD
jgi:hypothetical protein